MITLVIFGMGFLVSPGVLMNPQSLTTTAPPVNHDITTLTGVNITTLSGTPIRTIQ